MSKINRTYMPCLFLDSVICSINLFFTLMPMPCCLNYCSFMVKFSTEQYKSFTCFIQNHFCYSSFFFFFLHLYTHFRVILSKSTNEFAEIFIVIEFFGKNLYLKIMVLSQECKVYFSIYICLL